MAEEDEEVIIEGSALHKHLCSMGYTDFEIMCPSTTSDINANNIKVFAMKRYISNIYKNIHATCSWISQEDNVCETQIAAILQSEALLNDHAFIIHNIMQKHISTSFKTILQELFIFGSVAAISNCISFFSHKKIITYMFASSAICFITYVKHLRLCAQSDLRSLILLQNELYHLYKKAFLILKSTPSRKIQRNAISHHISGLTAKRLKYLQPIMEYLIKYMENVSYCYCKVSMIISQLLPSDLLVKYQITQFKNDSIKIHGEVNYKTLKNLYHKYILVQSEMLLLLAVAYDKETWANVYKKVPEFQLAYIVNTLAKVLGKYKQNLSQAIDDYYNSDIEISRFKYDGRSGSKWQGVYIHLDLASCKIQMAYKELELLLRDFYIFEQETENNAAEKLTQKIDEVCKLIDTAKSFMEFSSLLVPKIKRDNLELGNLIVNSPVPSNKPKIIMTSDTEPYIIDEVFEEYIKEEYYKSLYEEHGDVLSADSRLDKLLAKNFMSELKDVLVEKHKSMCARELKALQRTYKDPENNSLPNEGTREIPTFPPINDERPINDNSSDFDESFQEKIRESKDHSHRLKLEDVSDVSLHDLLQNSSHKNMLPAGKINIADVAVSENEVLETTLKLKNSSFDIGVAQQFALNLPAPTLKITEEIFIDDGEDLENVQTDNEDIENA